jgi:hypothetical protein
MKIKSILFFAFFYSLFLSGNNGPVNTSGLKKTIKGFTENKGQILDQNKNRNSNVKFLLSQPGLNVQLTKNGFSYDTYKNSSFHRIDIEFVNGNKSPEIIATGELPGYINYYLPEAPNGEALDIHSYQKVVYKNIYPNIDIEFFLNNKLSSGFEYNFVLRSGSNIGDIKLKYKGANKVELKDNKIKVIVAHGAFTEEIPKSFIIENGQEIKTDYSLIDKNTFGFLLPQKNISLLNKTLIIDPYPILSWGTYYGGDKYEYLNDVSSDPSGNVMICGYTTSTANIATAGAYQTTLSNPNMDGYLAKFNSSGVIQWATYYGGNCDVQINAIACDNSSNIYFTGQTCANTGISTVGSSQAAFGGGFSDAFLVKFSPSGTRIWGTYCGGGMYDWGYDLAIDGSGNIFLSGSTNSPNGIATFGVYQSALSGFGFDAFVVKYNSAGAKFWGSYYGGTGDEYAYGIAIYSGGPVFVGSTTSTSSITTGGVYQTAFGGGSQDGFMAALDGNGSFRLFGTYYGGASTETLRRVAVDASSGIIFTGESVSTGLSSAGSFKPVNGGNYDCVIAKFSGGTRQWATYFGVSSGEYGRDVALDASNNIYVTGNSGGTGSSGSVMTTPGAWQRPEGCGGDAFLIKLNGSGARQWSTLYGDQGGQTPLGISVNAGNIFIAGNTTTVSTLLATSGAYQSITNGGTNDGFLAMFTETATPNPTLSAISGPTVICGNSTYNYSVSPINTAGSNYNWYFPWATITNTANIVTTTTAPIPTAGTLSVSPSCDNSINATLAISVVLPIGGIGTITGNTLVCNGVPSTYSIAPSPNATYYIWNLPSGWTGTSTTNIINTIPGSSGNVSVTAANYCGTLGPMTKSITVDNPQISYIPVGTTCNGTCDGALTFTANGGISPYTYTPSATTSSLCAGNYTLSATDNIGCKTATVATISQPAPLSASAVNISSVTCNGSCNGSYSINVTGGTAGYTYSPSINPGSLCAGVQTFTVTDANMCTSVSTVNIFQPAPLTASITTSNPSICSGNSSTLTANTAGGTGPITYTWNTSSPNPSIVVSPTVTSTYYVFVSDVNSCINTTSQITITVNPLPSILTSASSSTVCAGQSTTLSVSGADTYSWSTGSTSANIVVSPTASITYSVIGTYSSTGCSANTGQSITVNPLPPVTAATSTFCSGTSGCLYGGGATTYTWVGPCAFVSTQQNPCFVYSGFCGCTFTVMGTDVNGCQNTATVCMNVLPNPTVTTVTSNSIICAGQTSTLTSNGALTYSWSTSATGSTTAVSPTVNSTYTVTGTDANGCLDTDTITQYVSACTGISEISLPRNISIYPNPNNGEFYLSVNRVNDNMMIEIQNTLGQTLKHESVIALQMKIDLSKESNGIYFVKVIDNGKPVYYSKIIKN